jgi:hypothetical protein
MLFTEDDMIRLLTRKVDCLGAATVATIGAITSVASVGLGVAQAAGAFGGGGGSAPNLPALPESKVAQESKQADKATANAIKSAKKRSGVAVPNTLLTGSQGVGDEELNLGGSRLV